MSRQLRAHKFAAGWDDWERGDVRCTTCPTRAAGWDAAQADFAASRRPVPPQQLARLTRDYGAGYAPDPAEVLNPRAALVIMALILAVGLWAVYNV